jgi:hypothetical protein
MPGASITGVGSGYVLPDPGDSTKNGTQLEMGASRVT